MLKPIPLVCVGFVCLAFALACPSATERQQPAGDGAKKSPDKAQPAATRGVFSLTKIHRFHLEIAAAEWQKMQPPRGGFGFGPGFGGPKKAPEKKADAPADVHKGAGFGLEFPWAHADFTANGTALKNVGLRFKGNFTYIASASGLKRPLQIDLNRYDGDQRWQGLGKLSLANGVTDPDRTRESLAFAVFRAAGVPAPRTAYAEITLTIPGKYDREFVGLYTLIEHVGANFLHGHFKSANGLLLKPEGLRGLDYLGEDWPPYEHRYRPKGEASKRDQQRLIAFTRLVNGGDDEQFRNQIGSFLDIDEFLRYLAVNALIASLDSPLGFGHNFFMYLRPDNRFVFIPWDLDLSMGTWPMGGPTEKQMELSLQHPHIGQHKLIDRLLAVKDINDKYQQILKDLTATCFTKEKLLKDIDAIEAAIKEPLAREKKATAARQEKIGGFGFGPPGGGIFGHGLDLREFVAKRTESVAAQLAGTSKGYVPAGMGFGPPGGFGGGPGPAVMRLPQPGEILPMPVQQMLKLTDEQKKQLSELQKEIDAKLKSILTDEQNKQLKSLRERGPGGFGPPGAPGFGPPGGPGGFNPGNPPPGGPAALPKKDFP
jgi:spore coat protein CotH